MADPAVIGDADQYRKVAKDAQRHRRSGGQVPRMEEGGGQPEAGARHAGGAATRSCAPWPKRKLARLEPELARIEERDQSPAAAQGPQRREERGARNPRRHRRRRSHSVRRRDLSHVLALRRNAGLEDRSHFGQRIRGGRLEGSDRAGERQQGLQQAEVRKRRASRAAGSGHRAAGPRAHLGHHGGGAAGSRRGGGQARPQGYPHRHVLLLRPGRPVGEHHLLRRAHHAPAHRPGGFLPGRKIADQEPRQGGARAALAAL